jgi:hypothetical protein
MFLTKMIKFAEKIGMDVDELMEMTVLDAILKIECKYSYYFFTQSFFSDNF